MKTVSKHVFLRLLLPITAGIVSRFYSEFSATACQWISFLTLLLLAFLLIVHTSYKRYQLYMKPWLPGLLFQVFVFLAAFTHTGSFLLNQQKHHFSYKHSDRYLVEISSEPQEKASSTRFEVIVNKALLGSARSHTEGRLLVTCLRDTALTTNLSIGDILLVPSRFSAIEGPANPGEFDYRRYMGNNGIWHQTFLSASEVVRVGERTGDLFYESTKLRKRVVRKLNEYIKDTEASGVISTLLLGYKADLSREILNTYSATGVMHVLSVSGMHVAIVAALAGYLLGIWKGRKMNIVQALLIIAFVWLYTLLSGLSAAACRSAVMVSFLIAGRLMNRNANMFNCVSAAAFFQLLIKPLWLFDIGFQLSYIAVFGLVLFYPAFNRMLKFRSRIYQIIWSCMAFSLAAQLATFPLCLYYFNQFPLYFLASNVFIMLPVTVVMYSGVGFLLMAFLPSFADLPLRCLAWLMESGINFLNSGLRFIGNLPSSSLHGYHLHVSFYMLIYVVIAFSFIGMTQKNKRAIWCALIVSVLLMSVYSISGLLGWNKKSIVFYSVRNHVALAFTRAGAATIVSDMSKGDKAISYSVLPLIRDRQLDLKTFADINTSFVESDLRVSDGRIRFQNIDLEVINGESLFLDRPEPTGVVRTRSEHAVDPIVRKRIVMLNNNPSFKLPLLLKNYDIRYIIIGMKNSKRNTDLWLAQADSLGIACHSLKQSGCLELDIEDL